MAILDTESAASSGGGQAAQLGEAIVEAQKLVKRYGRLTAVDGVSFAIRRGEIFGLLGPNGAGKSTTLDILEGMRAADGGTVLDRWAGCAAQPARDSGAHRCAASGDEPLRVPPGARDPRALRLLLSQGASRRRRCCARWRWRRRRMRFRRISPVGSANASRWLSRWSTIRRWSSSTSQPAGWTRRAVACSGSRSSACASAARRSC